MAMVYFSSGGFQNSREHNLLNTTFPYPRDHSSTTPKTLTHLTSQNKGLDFVLFPQENKHFQGQNKK